MKILWTAWILEPMKMILSFLLLHVARCLVLLHLVAVCGLFSVLSLAEWLLCWHSDQVLVLSIEEYNIPLPQKLLGYWLMMASFACNDISLDFTLIVPVKQLPKSISSLEINSRPFIRLSWSKKGLGHRYHKTACQSKIKSGIMNKTLFWLYCFSCSPGVVYDEVFDDVNYCLITIVHLVNFLPFSFRTSGNCLSWLLAVIHWKCKHLDHYDCWKWDKFVMSG